MSTKRSFSHVAIAGITFQAGSAAVDSATIMSALVFQLTGSTALVGAVTAILRFGWLFPQLIVGFLAQRTGSSMRYYIAGAFGRAGCMGLLALVLALGSRFESLQLVVPVMMLWTGYAFVSGIVAVPYNDIVARAVPSELRSRLLATRFFGGGLLALAIAAIANKFVGSLPFPASYAAIVAMAAALMFFSSFAFTSMGEPAADEKPKSSPNFFQYLIEGKEVFRRDGRFRHFVYAQWCGGAVLMAAPFYVVQANVSGFDLAHIALLLGAQTAGALASNALWGWWGDRLGKNSLLRAIVFGRMFPPTAIVLLAAIETAEAATMLYIFVSVFFVLGALANGLTIAVIGFLMEISPDNQRPAYSGYFNALTSPAFILPLLAGVVATYFGLLIIFIISAIAAGLQFHILCSMEKQPATNA